VKFEHYLLTRFNVNVFQGRNGSSFKTVFGKQLPMSPEAWMEHRLGLFEKFCAPSVANQDEKNFVWLLFVDPLTPKEYLERIERIVDHSIKMILVATDRTISLAGPSGIIASKWIKERLKRDTKWVLTSRCDNDDMLDRQFVAVVQQRAIVGNRMVVIDPINGYYFQPPNVLGHKNYRNCMFASFLEPAKGPVKTIISVPHRYTDKLGPKINIGGRLWMHVFHKTNAASRGPVKPELQVDAVMLKARFGYVA